MAKVKITVVKKAVHRDLLEKYAHPDAKAKGFDICTAFEEGQEMVLEGMKAPEGFCSWTVTAMASSLTSHRECRLSGPPAST